MIYQIQGSFSLSKTNISNCIGVYHIAFNHRYAETKTNVSFCNFEDLFSSVGITNFYASAGRVEKCNYINNSQEIDAQGLVLGYDSYLDINPSIFKYNRNNKNGFLFYLVNGQIIIHHSYIDDYSASSLYDGTVSTSETVLFPFPNDLNYIKISPCDDSIQNKVKTVVLRTDTLSLILSQDMTEIYEYWGYNFREPLLIPNNIIKIRSRAFENITDIDIEFWIAFGLSVIENYAFLNCSKLTIVEIPHDLTYLGFAAFKNCISLKSVSITSLNCEVMNNVFENCFSLVSISYINNISDNCFIGKHKYPFFC